MFKGLHLENIIPRTPKPVIDSISTRENIEINGGGDVDDDGPVEPYPTRCEVLETVSTIGNIPMT